MKSQGATKVRHGHREAQDMFLELGKALGFETARIYTRGDPTDGVWLFGSGAGMLKGLPAVAVEVVVSESSKAIGGSIHRLEIVSPVLGILVVHEEEIRRRLTRAGAKDAGIAAAIARDVLTIDEHIHHSKQRLQRWTFAQLHWAWSRTVTTGVRPQPPRHLMSQSA